MNLFETAKKSAPKTKKSKKEKVEVLLKGRNAKDLDTLVDLNERIADLQSQATLIDESIRAQGKKEFLKLYNDNGSYPESFNISTAKSTFLYVPQDKYLKIDSERAEELQEKYDESIVSTETTFGLDSKMVAKYSDVISKLITECDEIDEDDKTKLINANTVYAVAKESIKNAPDKNVAEYIEDIKPIFQIKNMKSID